MRARAPAGFTRVPGPGRDRTEPAPGAPAAKAVHRVERPTAIKVMAAGPADDVVLPAVGKTVEEWWVPELVT